MLDPADGGYVVGFPTGFIRGFAHFHKTQPQLRVLATAEPELPGRQ